MSPFLELALIFGRLGVVSFGGPLAHIALMRREFVERRAWVSDQEFLDLNGAVNLIPGPNSTELAMHIGYQRAGVAGLWVAGVCFIFPAFVLVLILAALYAKFGTVPQSRASLWGIAPVVAAIVLQALVKFAPAALKHRRAQCIAAAAFLAVAVGANEISVIFVAAGWGALSAWRHSKSENGRPTLVTTSDTSRFPLLLAPLVPSLGGTSAIFWSFFKIGSVIYGSGYVLLAYMRAEFVEKLALISDRQLLDAVAVGQMTPGPLFTSATFVGFQIGGLGGALAATAGIFLPSFAFVTLVAKLLGRWSGDIRMRVFLDCVNAASFALMTWVTLQLTRAALFPIERLGMSHFDWRTLVICAFATVLLQKTRFNSVLWIAGGALLGFCFGR